MSFWKELSRRNVYEVGVAWAVVTRLFIKVTAIVFPLLPSLYMLKINFLSNQHFQSKE